MKRSQARPAKEGGDWADTLGERLQDGPIESLLLSRAERYQLVAKARWFFLAFVAIYGCGAGLGYLFSDYGWFLTPSQGAGMIFGLLILLSYNYVYHFQNERLTHSAVGDYLQIVLDFFCVSLLIHLTGGAASWFWPVYLLVSFEAAILVESRARVIGLGLFGGLCYGIVLGSEYFNLLSYVQMPFIDPDLHHDGFYLLLMWFWVSLLNTIAAVVGAYLMTVIRRAYDQVQVTENRLKEFIHQTNDLIFSVTPEGKILYANQAWEEVLGYSRDDMSQMTFADVVDPDQRTKCLAEIQKVVNGEKVEELEGRLITKDGEGVEVESSLTCSFKDEEATAVWLICHDVTARKKAQEQLYFMAHHDLLTGLPNRLFFSDRLKQAQALAKRLKHLCAVLYLDLDRFKIINDTLGHAAGDDLLQKVAKRLNGCVRAVDTVGRLGGDEFAIVLVNINQLSDAEQVAGKILKALAKPVMIQENELFITTSIGISIYPTHSDDTTALLKKADAAMYQAKTHGRNNYQVYDEQMDQDQERRMELETSLRKAVEHNQFRIYYQPKVDVASGEITAMEALIRWEHPTLGMLTPADFIALAEETGMIVSIGEWVIRQACMDNLRWQSQGLPKVRVAVNLSGFQLQQKNLVDSVRGILEETGMRSDMLEFEIAETVIMQNPEFAVGVLSRLRDLGVHISIDDFGTGYSSLAHLKRFSVNTLKIDRTFVRDIEVNSTDAAITSAIISMGNSLNLKVIAEGVETEGQFNLLKEKHCDEMQGYLFSKPIPANEVEEMLRTGTGRGKKK